MKASCCGNGGIGRRLLVNHRPAGDCAGSDPNDATSSTRPVEDFAAGLVPLESLPTKPLSGKRVGVIKETMGEGVDDGVQEAIKAALLQLRALGARVNEVRCARGQCLGFRVSLGFRQCEMRMSPRSCPARL